ncbi:MAG TPA: bifunctional helix-turn-helix transcriptional regulator/GNAT family N-acetyltransferase [Acetobacteraceae bacterium]|jgi:DNA-binding MarR family transcriptional regulator/GNAT superfamily N-acetyltransferase
MPDQRLPSRIQAVRRFSRFYTVRIGLLHEGLLGGDLTLGEGRIIYELAQSGSTSASRLAGELGLDAGYLSRIVRSLEARGLIRRIPSTTDGRQSLLSLTEKGTEAFGVIDGRSGQEIGAMLEKLTLAEQVRLVAALKTAESLLSGDASSEPRVPYILRPPRPGDMGWIVHRQAVLYAEEYGWDETFEALVAEIVAHFVRTLDARLERCWVAERDDVVVGSVFLVRESDAVGKLRLLYVEPSARGLGIGRRLVDECIRFARQTGYRQVTLWTNDILVAARRIYQEAGFQLVDQERHHSFGHDLVGQNWTLDLR